jgi:cysteinyl-tRNA synthetase
MYIYNSLTNQKEIFIPLEKNKVKMYVCGPTVYNHVHIGNARPVIFFDVVRRFFEYIGYEVTYVSNITDVDDKIIREAIKENVDETVISKKFTEAFLTEVNRLNCLHYHNNPKVTEYMDKIIHFIEQLVQNGYAYESDGDVYFRVTKLNNYGRLSNQATEHLEVGARITNHDKKESPLDFTLWKKTDVGIKWDSPWGQGRPGWHTECVAMIHDTLGEKIDIHGGGSDLMFPHHENEIAQSEALVHTSLANYWMHNGRLMIDDEKMSKSLGNFILLKDFLDKYDQNILRFFMLSTHYRQPINYTFDNIEQSEKEIEKLGTVIKSLQHKLELNDVEIDKHIQAVNHVKEAIVREFTEALEDDFNTPNAITSIQKLVKEINKRTRKNQFTEEELLELTTLHQTMVELLNVLGIKYKIPSLTKEDIEIIQKRDQARLNKDFDLADHYRKQLQDKGINI